MDLGVAGFTDQVLPNMLLSVVSSNCGGGGCFIGLITGVAFKVAFPCQLLEDDFHSRSVGCEG